MSGGVLVPVESHYGPDGEEYVTRQGAAELMGVAPNTVSTWEKRGHLSRVPGCPPRCPLYRLTDVIEAEYRSREAALRTSGSEARVTRRFLPQAA